MKKTLIAATIACVAGAVVPAYAHDQGSVILRAGATTVNPDANSDPIVISSDLVLPNGVNVKSDTQLGLTVAYMFHQKFGIEVLASTPFSHKIELIDAPVAVGSTKHLPPTVSLQWYPRGGSEGFQPYIGAGVNYTTFFSEKTTDEFEEALGGLVGAGGAVDTRLKLDDSWGLAAQAGIDIPLGDHWMLNAAVWYIDIKTTAVVGLPELGAAVDFDVDIDPWVYNIGIGYRF